MRTVKWVLWPGMIMKQIHDSREQKKKQQRKKRIKDNERQTDRQNDFL